MGIWEGHGVEYHASRVEEAYIRNIARKYHDDEIIEAMEEVADRFFGGNIPAEGMWRDVVKSVGAYLFVRRAAEEDPLLRQAYIIRGAIKHRLFGRHFHDATHHIVNALRVGVSPVRLHIAIGRCASWPEARAAVASLIQALDDGDRAADR